MSEDKEKLARELFVYSVTEPNKEWAKDNWYKMPEDMKQGFLNVATHVQRLILETKISELKRFTDSNDSDMDKTDAAYLVNRHKELLKQLEALK